MDNLSKWDLAGSHVVTKKDRYPNFANAQNPKALFFV